MGQKECLSFRNEGTNSALAVLTALATFILVMPIVTVSTPGPYFTKNQLAFAGIASFAFYIAFLFFQRRKIKKQIVTFMRSSLAI